MVDLYPPPGHFHSPVLVLPSSLNVPVKLAGKPVCPNQMVRVSSRRRMRSTDPSSRATGATAAFGDGLRYALIIHCRMSNYVRLVSARR
jgi:hypothetical protein